jgi:hypothetical protein
MIDSGGGFGRIGVENLPRVVPVETPPPVGADLSALPTDYFV